MGTQTDKLPVPVGAEGDALTSGAGRPGDWQRPTAPSAPPPEQVRAAGEADTERAAAKRPRALRWLAAAAALIATAGVIAWYIRGQAASAVPPATAVVARRDLSATVMATGTIRAVVGAEVKVGSRIPGRVEQLTVQIGDRVKAGQVIARLEQAELRAGVDKARAGLATAEARSAQVAQDLSVIRESADTAIARETARLSAVRARLKLVLDGARPEEIAQAEATLRQAEANHSLATANADRARALSDQELIARQEMDTALREMGVAAAQVHAAGEQVALTRARYRPEEIQIAQDEVSQAEAGLAGARAEAGKVGVKQREREAAERQVDEAQAALRMAQANLGYATISAPISGVVASVSTQQGETVTSGSAAAQAPTFVTIIDLARLEVHAYVDETDIGKVAMGQSAVFSVDAFPEGEFTGTVTAIYPKALIQLNVVTYDVVIATDDREGLLRPDMTANVTITVARREKVLAIPNAAVRREEGARYALVQHAEQTARRPIKTGWRDRTYTEVLSGLTEGERVVVGDTRNTNPSTPGATLPPGPR